MTMLPERQNSTVTAIFKHYEKVAEAGQRPHLGASEIGGECERALWLSFRWAKQPDFDGRILRLFESGNLAEPRLIQNLRDIGVEVSDRDEDGNQWRFKAIGGHFGGSMDGAALGLPEAPKTWHVLEFKTANAKSFAAMQKKGVKDSKNQHWVQMQLYMGWAGLDRAMYMVVNKDTDDIYAERIEADPAAFKAALAKAERIITAPEPAIPLGETAAAFVCKFCRFKGQCHETEAPQVNCRTCAHATPELGDDARWSCAEHKKNLTVDEQRAGCRDHRHIPVLLGRFAELVDANENNLLTYKNKLTGTEFQQPVYGSQEITDCQDKRMLGDEFTTAMKIEMDATIVPNMLFLADSGERKTQADKMFVKPIQDYQNAQAEAAKPKLKDYKAALGAWEAKRGGVKDKIRQLAKDQKPTTSMESVLRDLEHAKPEPPKVPKLISAFEGMTDDIPWTNGEMIITGSKQWKK